MKCQEATALIEKLADGEATVEEKARAEAHLEKCQTCRAHYSFLTTMTETRQSQPSTEPPEAYWSSMTRNILARLAEDEVARSGDRAPSRAPLPSSGNAMRFVGLAAGIVLAVAVVWNVLLPGGEAPSSSRASSEGTAAPSIASPPPEAEEALPERNAPPTVASEPLRGSEAEAPAQDRKQVLQEESRLEPRSFAKSMEDAEADSAAPAEEFARAETRDAARPSAAQPRAEALRSRAAEETAPALGSAGSLSRAPSEAEPEARADCERIREALRTAGEDEGATDLRFQLARCELARYESEPTDETRARATAEAEAFLELESEGRRAEEMRRALSRLNR